MAKLVRRHPHVFADVTVSGAEEVTATGTRSSGKRRRNGPNGPGLPAERDGPPSALDGVPFGQPALALAAQLQRRAARAGVPDELAHLGGPGEPGAGDPAGPGADIGRELFRLVAQARAAGRDPEMELRAAARRYRDLVVAWERS